MLTGGACLLPHDRFLSGVYFFFHSWTKVKTKCSANLDIFQEHCCLYDKFPQRTFTAWDQLLSQSGGSIGRDDDSSFYLFALP
jgi:hypothetical protein